MASHAYTNQPADQDEADEESVLLCPRCVHIHQLTQELGGTFRKLTAEEWESNKDQFCFECGVDLKEAPDGI